MDQTETNSGLSVHGLGFCKQGVSLKNITRDYTNYEYKLTSLPQEVILTV